MGDKRSGTLGGGSLEAEAWSNGNADSRSSTATTAAGKPQGKLLALSSSPCPGV